MTQPTTTQTIEIRPDGTVLLTTHHYGDPPDTAGLHNGLALHVADQAVAGTDEEATVWRCATMLATAGTPPGSRLDPGEADELLEAFADAIRPLIRNEGATE